MIKWFIAIILTVVLVWSCDPFDRTPAAVKTYCSGCHILPDPSHLTVQTWTESILPTMADYFLWSEPSVFDYANRPIFQKKGGIAISDKEWNDIVDYYTSHAGLPADINYQQADIQPFLTETLLTDSLKSKTITAVTVDEGRIWYSTPGILLQYEKATEQTTKYPISGRTLSQIVVHDSDVQLLDVHNIAPHDQPSGSLLKLDQSHLETGFLEPVTTDLKRPVRIISYDSLIYISEFGHQSGQITKYNLSDQTRRSVLSLPGCYKLHRADINGDNIDEIIALCSQAQEGVYVIDTKTDEVKRLLAFPPEHGLSDLAIHDLNGDQLPDFVLTNGDNADYSIQAKTYHGIRVYLSTGRGSWRESYFAPMHGATQVQLLDVDSDDRMDIVASAFFPANREQSVMIYRSTSDDGSDYKPYGLSHAGKGSWMTMTQGDIDQDGDIDLVIANNDLAPATLPTIKQLVNSEVSSFLLLLNPATSD